MANETKLMPSEEEISEAVNKIEWSDAVAIVEVEVVNICERYSKDGDSEIAEKIEQAWLRILRG